MSPAKQEMIKAIITNAKLSEEEKSKIIAEIIDEFDKNYPDLKYHATKSDVKESELKLIKEIEQIRKEIKEVEAKLQKEIKEVENNLQKEIKEVELRFSKEIKEVELKLSKEIKEVEAKLSKEIAQTKASLLKWTFAFWVSQISVILGVGFFIVKLLLH